MAEDDDINQYTLRKLKWKPKKGPIKTTVPAKGGNMGVHVSLGEYSKTVCAEDWVIQGLQGSWACRCSRVIGQMGSTRF